MTLETLVPVNDSAPHIAAVRRIFSDDPGNPAAGTCGTLRRPPLSPPGDLPVSEGTDDDRANFRTPVKQDGGAFLCGVHKAGV